jgi:UDP-3-O-[3-hydroxymyristoyl] glucosamine N-acyltransferase
MSFVIDEIKKIDSNIILIKHFDSIIDTLEPIDSESHTQNSLTWCSEKNLNFLDNLHHTNIIIPDTYDLSMNKTINYIKHKNPRRLFQIIIAQFFAQPPKLGISTHSIINENVILGKDLFIGNNVVIESGCVIGDNVKIDHNTVIKKNTQISNSVTIGANCVIGGCGFGYEKNQNGDYEVIPHIGNVVIKENVEIGNNTCIDRAVLGSTVINENVKIDNLVHIAHGVNIGRNTVIIANAMIAGSVKIGSNSWVAPSASILNKKMVGENSIVGLGAVVVKDVSSNSVVIGNPAKPLEK